MHHIQSLKGQRPITALTAYDYSMSKILNKAGIDLILVGDSLGMVVLGYESTHFVTLDDIIRHTQAVMRGNSQALVVADMPIGTYDTKEDALRNCQRVILETGIQAVKIEGKPEIAASLCRSGISVLGHTGLKPQEVDQYSVQGQDPETAKGIKEEAQKIEEAGAFAIILECIPEKLGKEITSSLKIPTIGIGAGRFTDGQILVSADILGMFDDIKPRFVRRYANISKEIAKAVEHFKEDVIEGKYPSKKEVY